MEAAAIDARPQASARLHSEALVIPDRASASGMTKSESILRIHADRRRLERGPPARIFPSVSSKSARCGPEARAPTLLDTRKSIPHPNIERTLLPVAHGRFRRAPKLWNVRRGIGAVTVGAVRKHRIASSSSGNARGPKGTTLPLPNERSERAFTCLLNMAGSTISFFGRSMRATPARGYGIKAPAGSLGWKGPPTPFANPGQTIL